MLIDSDVRLCRMRKTRFGFTSSVPDIKLRDLATLYPVWVGLLANCSTVLSINSKASRKISHSL